MGLKRPARTPGKSDRSKSAWPLADLPKPPKGKATPEGTPEGDDARPPDPLLADMAQTLAALEGVRERIHQENRYIERAASTLEDDHRQAADGLREHLASSGVGTDPDESEPVAEDMYGQHLLDRARAADLHGALERRNADHVRKLTHRRKRRRAR